MNLSRLLTPDLIWVVIPVTAIVMFGITEILRQVHRHRERQAMIEQGMHPDLPKEPRPESQKASMPSTLPGRTLQ